MSFLSLQSSKLKEYAEKHIKALKCNRLVLNEDNGGNRCHCGRLQEDHDDYNNPFDKPWEKNRDLVEMTTNAYGEMKLSGFKEFPGTRIKYIRASWTNDLCEHLYHIMTEIWKYPKPDLIISIIGCTKKMIPLTNEQRSEFKRGLINVSKTASTWIITGGFDFGVPKLVGESTRDHKIASQPKTSTVIGMCTWGAVHNRHNLTVLKDNEVTYHNAVSSFNLKTQALLDTNHDAFILFDSGTEGDFGMEIGFRAEFETSVSKTAKCSAVNVIVGGGEECIKTIYDALVVDIPVVVMQGSNWIADLICNTLNSKENLVEDVINSGLKKNRKEWSENEKKDLRDQLSSLYDLKKENLIHIFSTSDHNKYLDSAIMEAAFSSKIDGKSMTYEEKLKMTMNFDRADVAREFIMETSEPRECLNEEVYKKYIKIALQNGQWKFVQLFLSHGTKVEWFLTKEILKDLYSDINVKKHTSPAVFSIIEILMSNGENNIWKIGPLVKSLTKGLIPTLNYGTKEKVTFTEQDLFIWALLTQKFEMSKIFWESGKDHIASALIASVICHSLVHIARKEKELDIVLTLKSYVKEYENLAIKVLTEAYSRDKIRTHLLLIRTLPNWNYVTCMQIAQKGKIVNFLSQSACQTRLNNIWMGGLGTSFIFLFIPCLPILMFKTYKPMKTNWEMAGIHKTSNVTPPDYLTEFGNKQHIAWNNTSSFKAIYMYFNAPLTKFSVHAIIYIAFLVIFSYTLLVELLPPSQVTSSYQRKMEYVVYVYVGSSIIEEIRQALFSYQYGTYEERLVYWITSIWNILDLFLYIMFIIAVVLRHITTVDFVYARTIFSITLSIFYLRFLQFYYVDQSIGPKVISVRRMMKDILFFLAIYVVAIFAYGTFAQALLYSNSPLDIYLLKNIVYMPYWQSYGDLQIEYVEGNVTINNGVQPTPNAIVIVAFAFYMLFTNVLLMNMLVAMFGKTFQKVEENSNRIWAFKRYRLIEEYYYRPLLPIPFNIIEIPWTFVNYHRMKWTTKNVETKNDFVVNLCQVEDIRSAEFEQQCLEKILRDNPLLQDENEQSFSTLFIMDSFNEMKREIKEVSKNLHKMKIRQKRDGAINGSKKNNLLTLVDSDVS